MATIIAPRSGASTPPIQIASGGGGGINPQILKFLVALVIVTGAISLLEGVSQRAAVLLASVIILLLFVKDSPLPYWLNQGSKALQTGIA